MHYVTVIAAAAIAAIVLVRYDTIDDLHWKTDRQAASLI